MFGKIFGKKDPVDSIAKLVGQSRFAEALIDAQSIDSSSLAAEKKALLDVAVQQARESLVSINLDEAMGWHRSGDQLKVIEHLELAEQYATTKQQRAEIARVRALKPEDLVDESESEKSGSSSTRSSDAAAKSNDSSDVCDWQEHIDLDVRFDLIVAQYPDNVADLYATISPEFMTAVVLAHDGDAKNALRMFDSLPENEKGAVWHFERGQALSDSGKSKEAIFAFNSSVSSAPDYPFFFRRYIDYHFEQGLQNKIVSTLTKRQKEDSVGSFCSARLALMHYQKGEGSKALDLAVAAMDAGFCEPEHLLLTAKLLESEGRLDEAEGIYARLPGGGCSGSNFHLADFWIRNGKNLGKAIDAMKSVLRQDPNNPELLVRLAEGYVKKGWKKEGERIINNLLASSDVPQEVKTIAESLLKS